MTQLRERQRGQREKKRENGLERSAYIQQARPLQKFAQNVFQAKVPNAKKMKDRESLFSFS